MRSDQVICGNARVVTICDRKNAGEMLRRNAPAFPPPINGDRFDFAFICDFDPGTNPRQQCFDLCAHVLNNDYFSHKVKRLIQ